LLNEAGNNQTERKMKNFFLWPLTLILLLAAIPFAWGQSGFDNFDQRLRAGLKELVPGLEIDFERLKVMDDGGKIVINKMVIANAVLSPTAAEQGEPAAKITIERLEIIKPNFSAFTNSAPSLLAEQLKLEEMRVESADGSVTTVEMTLLNQPSAPWMDIYSLKNKTRAQLLAWLGSQVRIGGVEKRGVRLVNRDDIFSIDKITARNWTLFNSPDISVSGLSALQSGGGSRLTIGQIKFGYDFSAPFKAWLSGGAPENGVSQYLRTHKFGYNFTINDVKAYIPDADGSSPNILIFSVKNAAFDTAVLPPESSYNCSIDNLKIANEFLQFKFEPALKLLLKGKPLELSIKSSGRLVPGKFYPSGFDLTAPNLANLKFSLNASLTPEAMEAIMGSLGDSVDDFFLTWWDTSKNILLEKFSLDYQDKGLINGIFAVMAGSENKIKDTREITLAQIDQELRRRQPGDSKFAYDLLKNFRTLLQKPGAMSITLTPSRPTKLEDMIDQLENNGPVKYSIRVK
jgi:hypothetical protein